MNIQEHGLKSITFGEVLIDNAVPPFTVLDICLRSSDGSSLEIRLSMLNSELTDWARVLEDAAQQIRAERQEKKETQEAENWKNRTPQFDGRSVDTAGMTPYSVIAEDVEKAIDPECYTCNHKKSEHCQGHEACTCGESDCDCRAFTQSPF